MDLEINREVLMGGGVKGELYLGDCLELTQTLRKKYAGKVQCVYIDPPFFTGRSFEMRARVGSGEWKSGNGSLHLEAYDDRYADRADYLGQMSEILQLARGLLQDTGVIFLHVDYRMSAHLHLLMDDIFGESNFLNEIIWTYQTGGRAKQYFSRKHDVILLYRKTRNYTFYLENVPISRTDTRRNHMKRERDQDGREYSTIKSGGKVYKYYDDDPAYPGDVWDDISHLQQKDPQRTGYDTQKPLKLLERIVLSSTKPGDLVCDLCCGSGTTLEAAALHGRTFLGVDRSPLAVQTARRRLIGHKVNVAMPADEPDADVDIEVITGVGNYECYLNGYALRDSDREFDGLEAVTSWSGGYIYDDVFYSYVHDMRSRQHPELEAHLSLPVWEGKPALRIENVYGQAIYRLIDGV